MGEYEKQHIVPQAYLNRFGTKGRKKYRIGVFQKDAGQGTVKEFCNSVDNVGYIRNYYDVSCRDDVKHWEHYYANNLEPLYGDRLGSIISSITLANRENYYLSREDQFNLATMMSAQILRFPPLIDRWSHEAKKMFPGIKNNLLRSHESSITKKDKQRLHSFQFPSDFYKDLVLGVATNQKRLEYYSEVLLSRIWCVFYNSTDIPFMTSDNPVVLCELGKGKPIYENYGIANVDTTIYYPLSPKIMLQLFSDKLILGDKESFKPKIRVLGERERDFILQCNKRQFEHCYRETFVPLPLMRQILADRDGL